MATRSGADLVIEVRGKGIDTGITPNGVVASIDSRTTRSWAAGSTTGLADLVWMSTYTVNTTGTSHNLHTGLLDPADQSATLTFDRLHAIKVVNGGSNAARIGNIANALSLFGATSSYLEVPAGGALALALGSSAGDGITVTSASDDVLHIAADSGTTEVTVTLIGR